MSNGGQRQIEQSMPKEKNLDYNEFHAFVKRCRTLTIQDKIALHLILGGMISAAQ